MTNPGDRSGGLSRRSILLGGGLALVALLVIGGLIQVPFIQNDLRDAVSARLSTAGFEARVDFVGQDGTLRCAAKLADPLTARRIASSVRGVRSITVDPSCTSAAVPDTTTTTSSTIDSTVDSTAASTTAPAATEPSSSTSSTTSSTTTTSTITTSTITTSTTLPGPRKLLSVRLVNGTLHLEGAVATPAQQTKIRDAANAAVDPSNVVGGLTVDTLVAVSDADAASIAAMLGAMPKPLAGGEVGRTEAGLYATGVYVVDAGRVAFQRVVVAAGVLPALTIRPAATAADAAALQAEMNSIVAADPILFAKGKAVINPASLATLQRVAGVAKRFEGLVIDVQGHTDSAGVPGQNQTLSVLRARKVRDALITLGVPARDLTATGFGGTQPVTDQNGIEIPAASRRVVFGVTTR